MKWIWIILLVTVLVTISVTATVLISQRGIKSQNTLVPTQFPNIQTTISQGNSPTEQPPTQTTTQAPTQITTQAPTQITTQAPTQITTQPPTRTTTQPPTQTTTQAPTQTTTQAPTQTTSYRNFITKNLTLQASYGARQPTPKRDNNGEPFIQSLNGRYRLYLEKNGNLVIYDITNWQIIWQTNTRVTSSRVNTVKIIINDQGNVILYGIGLNYEMALWNTGMWDENDIVNIEKGPKLILKNDGNLVLYSSDLSKSYWSSNTNESEISYIPYLE